ncbi:hypothetical protein ANN_24519 [Periplaneta americana]|uniref:Uncharacterized protein n=1 Tax=Periplaneta americana TaxID=6978 RepID=A0ABQ8S3L2_PERAM|nr:hypothetical protein ANN_24519 [Periplaneta americana]
MQPVVVYSYERETRAVTKCTTNTLELLILIFIMSLIDFVAVKFRMHFSVFRVFCLGFRVTLQEWHGLMKEYQT